MQNKFSCSKACLCLDNNDLNMNKCNPNDHIDCECNNSTNKITRNKKIIIGNIISKI
jgi:hypothetical protein